MKTKERRVTRCSFNSSDIRVVFTQLLNQQEETVNCWFDEEGRACIQRPCK